MHGDHAVCRLRTMQSVDCILSPMQSEDCAGSQIACNILVGIRGLVVFYTNKIAAVIL